jgi:hypothetical protein
VRERRGWLVEEEGTAELLPTVRRVVSGQKVSYTYPEEEEDRFDPFLASVENLADIDVDSRIVLYCRGRSGSGRCSLDVS